MNTPLIYSSVFGTLDSMIATTMVFEPLLNKCNNTNNTTSSTDTLIRIIQHKFKVCFCIAVLCRPTFSVLLNEYQWFVMNASFHEWVD